MKNILFLTEIAPGEFLFEIEADNGMPVASGRESGERSAVAADLEKRFDAVLYVDFPPEGIALPDEWEVSVRPKWSGIDETDPDTASRVLANYPTL